MNYNNKAMLVGAMLVAGYDAKNGGQVGRRDTAAAPVAPASVHCPRLCSFHPCSLHGCPCRLHPHAMTCRTRWKSGSEARRRLTQAVLARCCGSAQAAIQILSWCVHVTAAAAAPQVFGCPIGGTMVEEGWAIDGSGSTYIWGYMDGAWK